MKKTAKLIEKLIRLANGDALPASSLKGAWFEQMQNDGILLATAHGSRKSFRASDGMTLRQYVASQIFLLTVDVCIIKTCFKFAKIFNSLRTTFDSLTYFIVFCF